MTCIAGIDFGTSNSAVSISIDFNEPKLIKFEYEGKKYNTIPTVVSFCDDNRVLYGRAAIDAYQQGDVAEKGRFIRSIKRIVSNNLHLHDSTRIGLKNVHFLDIVKNFFAYLKTHTEKEIGQTIDYVVIGRPVVFVDNNKNADLETENEIRKIAEEIGFKNIAFQYEPIAAAFAYEQKINNERLALIVDIGAGTSDFSVIKMLPKSNSQYDRQRDILANTGINIAGDDFDYDFSLHSFMKHFGYRTQYKTFESSMTLPGGIFHHLSNWTQYTPEEIQEEMNKYHNAWNNAYETKCIDRLKNIVDTYSKYDLLTKIENTKIYLSDKPEKHLNLGYADNNCPVNISRDDLEIALHESLDKIQDKINECIEKSGKSKKDIQTIIFTGGSSQIPLLQLNIINMFPHITPENIIKTDVFSSVCVGLAYHGMNIWRKK